MIVKLPTVPNDALLTKRVPVEQEGCVECKEDKKEKEEKE